MNLRDEMFKYQEIHRADLTRLGRVLLRPKVFKQ
jgi:hypothetical protein